MSSDATSPLLVTTQDDIAGTIVATSDSSTFETMGEETRDTVSPDILWELCKSWYR